MEDYKKKENRVESDNEYYLGIYCKYCDNYYKARAITRHFNSYKHKCNQIFYKNDNIENQIHNRMIQDFNRGCYDPDDPNLWGEDRKKRLKQVERETWRLYDEARRDGYFDGFDYDEEIDFPRYFFYHRQGIKLNLRKEPERVYREHLGEGYGDEIELDYSNC